MTTASRRSSSSSSISEHGSFAQKDESSLRASLRPEFPEIDELHSDAYLRSVLSVPDRTYEYARDKKIRGALEWRRSFGVDGLREAFRYEENDGSGPGGGRLVPNPIGSAVAANCNGYGDDEEEEANGGRKVGPAARFRPSAELIELCLSGAFSVLVPSKEGSGDDGNGPSGRRRLVLCARTAMIDWWKAGVDAGLQYHVLVIEHALSLVRESQGALPESMTLMVDTKGMGLVPPPVGALSGLVGLLQRAYPDRIHRIVVFPVGGLLKKLYNLVYPMMAQRSRDKIVLAESAEEAHAVGDCVQKGD